MFVFSYSICVLLIDLTSLFVIVVVNSLFMIMTYSYVVTGFVVNGPLEPFVDILRSSELHNAITRPQSEDNEGKHLSILPFHCPYHATFKTFTHLFLHADENNNYETCPSSNNIYFLRKI